MKRAAVLVVALIVAFAFGARSEDAAPLTNADIVKLTTLGLGDDVIVAKIRQAGNTAFSLEVADIEKLHGASVSNTVIAAMLQRATGGSLSAGGPAPTVDVWTLVDGRPLEIPGIAGFVEQDIGQAIKSAFLFSFKQRVAVIASGTSAKTRLASAPGALYTKYMPSEIGVAKLTVQADKGRRLVWLVAQTGSTRGEVDPPQHDMKFSDERNGDGSYKLTFKAPLTPGEYVLVGPPRGSAGRGALGHILHDFAIDPK